MFSIVEGHKIDFSVSLIKEEPSELALGSNRFYFYTNTLNLASFLSSGLIYPISRAEDHDIEDLSSSNGRGLIFFRNTVSYKTCLDSWLEELNIPVSVSVNLDNYSGSLFAINKDYLASEKTIAKLSEDDIAVFLPGCIPLSAAENFYVKEEAQIKSFLSKKEFFGEVPLNLVPLKASDNFFGNSNYDVLTLRALIKSLDLSGYEFLPENIILVKKYIAFITAAIRFVESSNNLRLILDFVTLLSLLPANDMKNFTERYKKIKSNGLDYENFHFEQSFHLLIPIIGVRYSNGEILEDFKLFLKEIPSKKKLDTKDIIKYFLNFAVLRILLGASGVEGEIKNELIKRLETEFSNFVKVSKKITNKIADKYLKAFKNVYDILEYKKELDSVKDWEAELNPIKILLLLSFNNDFERSIHLINDKAKYTLSDSDIYKITLLSSLYNGINGLKSEYKTKKAFLSGITSVIPSLFKAGVLISNAKYTPNLQSKKINSECMEYSVSGLDNLLIKFSITEKSEDINKTVKNLISELDPYQICKLASILGFSELVESEIVFDGEIGDLSLKDLTADGQRKIIINVRGKPPKIKYNISEEKFFQKLNENNNILIDRNKVYEILDKFKREEKK